MAKRENEDSTGFIQNLSPKKRSVKGNKWFDFQFQTESQERRVVGFDDSVYSRLQSLEKTKSPVKINFTPGKSDIMDKQTSVVELQNFDVSFPYRQIAPSSSSITLPESKQIDIRSVKKCVPGAFEQFSVKVVVVYGSKPNKIVNFDGIDKDVKEDVIILDAEDFIFLHLWEEQIGKIEDKQTYAMSHLVLRQFRGKVFLTATRNTVIEKIGRIDVEDKMIQQCYERLNSTREVMVEEIHIVKNISKYVTCVSCKRKVDIVPGKKIVKCTHCKTAGRLTSFAPSMTMEIFIKTSATCPGIWLTVFTEGVKAMCSDVLSLTEDAIEERVLELEKLNIKYDVESNSVLSINVVEEMS